MYAKLPTKEIIFFYKHDDLFDEVKHQSAFMCKNVVSKDGDDLSERFAVTDDEEPMFKLGLRESMPDIFDVLHPLCWTPSVDNEYESNSALYYDDITGDGILDLNEDYDGLTDELSETAHYTVFFVRDNEAYDPNRILKVVDSALRASVESGALSFFYSRVVHQELTQLSASMFAGQLNALANRIVPLRKKKMSFS